MRSQLLATAAALLAVVPLGLCAPTAIQYSRGVDWLSRYGYLPSPDPRTGTLQTRDGIQRALRQMQSFAGLEQTGALDRATLALMQTPRCSLPDVMGPEDLRRRKRRRRKRYALTGLRWQKTDISWSVHSYPSSDRSPSLGPDLVDLILTYALRVWADLIPLDFHLLRPASTTASRPAADPDAGQREGDIRVMFTGSYHHDGYPFDGRGGTLAHAFFPGTASMAGDTHFDDGESWSYGYGDDSGTTDLFTVAVHEFGHALGLSHSSFHLSIMRPYYQGTVGDIESYTLPVDDMLGIQALYGKRGRSSVVPTAAPTTPHLPRLPSPATPGGTPRLDPALPDRCQGTYDAVANIRGEVFFFKGPFFWRAQQGGSLVSSAPARIHNFWLGLPLETDKVDAVYERSDGRIVFFIGAHYWVFKDRASLPGYPRPLADWGLRSGAGRTPDRVEAAFVWAHNGKTYLFSRREFWRFSDGAEEDRTPEAGYPKMASRTPEAGYPKMASLWTGVPSDPDDIISWGNGDTYFFKDSSYWVLQRGGLGQGDATSRSVAVDWMRCEDPGPVPTPQSDPVPPQSDPGPRGADCHCARSSAMASQASGYLVKSLVSFLVLPFSATLL